MVARNRSSIFTVFLVLAACSLAACSALMELSKQEPDFQVLPKRTPTLNNCIGVDHRDSILGPTKKFNENFLEFLQLAQKKYRLNIQEKFFLLGLAMLNARPDKVTPFSDLYLTHNLGTGNKYTLFTIKKTEPPPRLQKEKATEHLKKEKPSKPGPPSPESYLFGLENLLKANKASRSALELVSIFEALYPFPVRIGPRLAEFLKNNESELKSNSVFGQSFFKGDQLATVNEGLPKLPFKKIIQNYHRHKSHFASDIIQENFLFSSQPKKHEANEKIQIHCNFDLGLYQNGIYVISSRAREAPVFGIRSQGHWILAMASFRTEFPTPFEDTFLLAGQNQARPLSICMIKNESSGLDLTLFSSEGRDPGQHLNNLIEMGIFRSKSVIELTEYLNFPRHLFLINPPRMLYEGHRSEQDSLDNIQAMQFPLYNVEGLGQVTAMIGQKGSETGLISDSRSLTQVSCRE